MLKCFPVTKGKRSSTAVDTVMEGTTYHLQLEADEVYCNCIPLRPIFERQLWELRTPFAVGEAQISFRLHGVIHHRTLTVTPNPHKIEDRDLWESMLKDLLDWMESLLGHQGLRDGSVSMGERQHYLLLEALQPLLIGFERSLTHLFEHLREKIITPNTPLTIFALRTPFPLTQIATDPTAMAWLKGSGTTADVPIVEAPFVQQTFNHPVNRYIRWLVEQILERLEDAVLRLGKISQEEQKEPHWRLVQANVMAHRALKLREILEMSPLRDLEPSPLEDTAFLVILNDPLYASVHQSGRLLMYQCLDFSTKGFAPSMNRSFDIYELWSYQAVVRQCGDVLGAQPVYHNLQQDSHNPQWGTVAEFQTGAEMWRIEFNARFPSSPPQSPSRQRHSVLGEGRPDIVVYYENPESNEYRWMVLDAKYRTSKTNLLAAFSSALRYNQALFDPRFGGNPVGSYLLTPKSLPETKKWYGRVFASAHPFGAFECRPNVENAKQTRGLGTFIVDALRKNVSYQSSDRAK